MSDTDAEKRIEFEAALAAADAQRDEARFERDSYVAAHNEERARAVRAEGLVELLRGRCVQLQREAVADRERISEARERVTRAEALLATLRNAFCKHCGFAVTVDVQEVVAAKGRARAIERRLLVATNAIEEIVAEDWRIEKDGDPVLIADRALHVLMGDDSRVDAFLAPTEPDGASGTKETDR